MVNVYSVSDKDKSLSGTKRNRYIALGVIVGLCLVYLMRGCTWESSSEPRYNIGQDSRWRNLNLMGKERNLAAFNNDLLTAIAKQKHFRIHLVIASASELIEDLEKGKLQGALTSLQSSYSNENQLVFSDPFFLTGPVLIIPSTAPIDGWNEKRRKIVGIQANSHQLLNFEQDPSIQIKLYDDMLHALTDLSERRIDGALLPALPAYTYVTTFYKNELKIATSPLTDEGIRLVTLKNDEGKSLIKLFDEGLAELKQNGTYHKILEQWGLINTEKTEPSF
jgi:polar amino acid transport system substrate-binding protein